MIGLPAPAPSSDRYRGAGVARDALIVLALIVGVTALHLYASAVDAPASLHLLYRRLYYLPVFYAAWAFGLKGGLAAAATAAVSFGVHAQVQLEGLLDTGLDNALEIVMLFAIGGLFGWLRDLEERRTRDLRQVGAQLEEAYRKLEERAIQLINIQDYTQSILRSITSGVITVGPDGSVATANPAAERIFGMAEFDMVPRPLVSLFADDAGLGRDVGKVLDGRLPRMMREMKLVTEGHQTVHAQVSASRMRAVGGRILGAVITIEDLSEVKSLTDQLIRADRLAAMGQLTAGVAHEVRNPLGVIRASVQLIEDARRDPSRAAEAIRVIKQEIDRLDRVIKALLDFGRPSAPVMAPVELPGVLDDVMLFTRKFADRANVTIEVDHGSEPIVVFGDADQLKQVFLNLVTNAVQVMGEDGGRIAVGTVLDDGFVRVSVSDDGPGVPPAELGRVFDPFYSRREDGTGLGLTIVHRIVDEHDGHIEVRSAPGEGTVFTVVLPAYAGGPQGGVGT